MFSLIFPNYQVFITFSIKTRKNTLHNLEFIVVFMSLMAKIWTFHSFTIKIWVSWWQRYELFISLPSRFVSLDGKDMNFSYLYHQDMCFLMVLIWTFISLPSRYSFLDGVDMKFHISTIKIYVSWWCWYEISYLYHQDTCFLMVKIWNFHISTIKKHLLMVKIWNFHSFTIKI